MTNFLKKFIADEDGAVTVDWVVLTAGIVVLGLAVGSKVATGASDMAGSIEKSLTDANAPTVSFNTTGGGAGS